MKKSRSEKTRNEEAWSDPASWRFGILGIYHAPRDTRWIVPKRNPKMGWTFNFAHPGSWWFLTCLLMVAVVSILVAVLVERIQP